MIEKACNLWHERADYRCIPVSGTISREGVAVLDSAVGARAVELYAGLAEDLGHLIAARGNQVHLIRPGLVSFPIKQYQWSPPSLQIIERSAKQLCAVVGDAKTLLPRPGCERGGLDWAEVSKVLAFLPDNIVVVPV